MITALPAKRCTKCGEEKPVTEFNRKAAGRDGLNARCRLCVHEARQLRISIFNGSGPELLRSEKRCTDCQKVLPIQMFSVSKSALDGRQSRCKACGKKCRRPEQNRIYNLRHKYGISEDKYIKLLVAQGRRCAICQTASPGGQGNVFHVDHDHATGEIRGLLCTKCNTGIGHLNDDPDRLEAAAKYLRRYKNGSHQ